MSASVIQAISADNIVRITPSVLAAGGASVLLNGLFLTKSPRVPIGQVLRFPGVPAVQSYFGLSADEVTKAAGPYFLGYDNSFTKPAQILYAQYPAAAVGGWLRGGPLGKTLAQLQAITSGEITVPINGLNVTSSALNFATTTSFSDAAELITEALSGEGGATFTGAMTSATAPNRSVLTVSGSITGAVLVGMVLGGTSVPGNTIVTAQLSGTPGAAGTYSTNVSLGSPITAEAMTAVPGITGPAGASFTGALAVAVAPAPSVLTVSGSVTGTVTAGQELVGASVPAGAMVGSQITGTVGGDGTYLTNLALVSPITSEAMTTNTPLVTWDAVAGAFLIQSGITGVNSSVSYATGTRATALALTLAAGAVTSPGAAPTDPATFMSGLLRVTRAWATFTTMFDPDAGSGNDVKKAFAVWTNTNSPRFAYVPWDTDMAPATTQPATSSLGYYLTANNLSGTVPQWVGSTGDVTYSAFLMGSIASVDYNRTNGRATMAFRSQTGLPPLVRDDLTYANLGLNGYDFYGTYSTSNQDFTFEYPGSISGPWQWVDSYVNQIWLSANFQNSLMVMMVANGTIPYNDQGDALIAAALGDPIRSAGNAGIYRQNVPLSQLEKETVTSQAGSGVADTLATRGWYLQTNAAATVPSVRAARGSPPVTFWYMDGESIQSVNMASILVQ